MTLSDSLESRDRTDDFPEAHFELSETVDLRSRRPVSWHSVVLLILACGLMVCMFVVPLVEHYYQIHVQTESFAKIEPMTLGETIRQRAIQTLGGLWFFILGGTIGSFLNVVVYRWPRGESIVSTPSRCPDCSTAIQVRDNVPVIGWLALGGRCRACGMPIDIRYPVIEAITGLLFFLFLVVQLANGNSNVPGLDEPRFAAGSSILYLPKPEHLFLYFFHCLLACVALVWSLIDFDSQRLGKRAAWIAGLFVLVPVLVWPAILLAPLGVAEPIAGVKGWVLTALFSMMGGFVGWLAGWITQRLFQDSIYAPAILGWFGMGLGWYAVIAILMVSLLIRFASWLPLRAIGVPIPPWSMNLFLGFVIHHTIWRWTIETFSPYWPGQNATLAGWVVILVTAALLTAINYWAQRLENRAARSGYATGSADVESNY